MSTLEPGIEFRYESVVRALKATADACGRAPSDVKLLAVGKTFDESALLKCAELGQRAFGENYAQEGCAKVDWFRENRPDLKLEWHFIGPLQANKTRPVAERFDWVETLDRLRIAKRLSEQRPEDMAPLNVLVEINIDGEDSKSGIAPEALEPFASALSALPRLRLRGLMAIPAPADDEAARMKPLEAMRRLFDNYRARHPEAVDFDTLSIGMSADLREAVKAGSTEVRIGSAIFGRRDYGARPQQ